MFITINQLPPTVNHMYKRAKNGKLYMTPEAKEFKNNLTDLARLECNLKKWKMHNKEVFFKIYIKFVFDKKNKKFCDPNNMLKAPLDALQGVVYKNDKWVTFDVDAELGERNLTLIAWDFKK